MKFIIRLFNQLIMVIYNFASIPSCFNCLVKKIVEYVLLMWL